MASVPTNPSPQLKPQTAFDVVNDYSQTLGLPLNLILPIIAEESGGNPQAVGSSGERGLFQLNPTSFPGTTNATLADPTSDVNFQQVEKYSSAYRTLQSTGQLTPAAFFHQATFIQNPQNPTTYEHILNTYYSDPFVLQGTATILTTDATKYYQTSGAQPIGRAPIFTNTGASATPAPAPAPGNANTPCQPGLPLFGSIAPNTPVLGGIICGASAETSALGQQNTDLNKSVDSLIKLLPALVIIIVIALAWGFAHRGINIRP